MDITPDVPNGVNIINAYDDNGFKISEKNYIGSLVVNIENITQVKLSSQEINQEGKIISLLNNIDTIEVLLVGTGKKHLRLQHNIRQEIKDKFSGVCVDEMSTSAVCRTYNILALEDRKVAAILVVD